MDMICPVCLEPWDADSVYHENDRSDLTPSAAYKLFREKGCGAIFDGVDCTPPKDAEGKGKAMILSELAGLLGDDGDGYAATVEDFGL